MNIKIIDVIISIEKITDDKGLFLCYRSSIKSDGMDSYGSFGDTEMESVSSLLSFAGHMYFSHKKEDTSI